MTGASLSSWASPQSAVGMEIGMLTRSGSGSGASSRAGASRSILAVRLCIVTSSSAAVGWTGIVAGLIDIFGTLDPQTFLEGGREATFGREKVTV